MSQPASHSLSRTLLHLPASSLSLHAPQSSRPRPTSSSHLYRLELNGRVPPLISSKSQRQRSLLVRLWSTLSPVRRHSRAATLAPSQFEADLSALVFTADHPAQTCACSVKDSCSRSHTADLARWEFTSALRGPNSANTPRTTFDLTAS